MHGVRTLWTWRNWTMTPTTTQVSGPNTADYSARRERLLGELSEILKEDPYWGICIELWKLLSRKRGYYGCANNPLENALGVEEDGISPWKYQIARVGEKCRRLRGTLRAIDIRKTILDIAGHAVVGIAVLDYEDEYESESYSLASGSSGPAESGS